MAYKTWLTIFLFTFCLNTTFSQNLFKKVVILGNFTNFQNQAQVEDLSEFGKLSLPTLERCFIPDSNGNFSVSFYLNQPNYFSLGRNILYLSPGDSLYVKIDFNKPQQAIFQGYPFSSIRANEYLRFTPYPKEGSYLQSEDFIQETIQSSIDTVIAIGSAREKALEQLKDLSPEFLRLEKGRIKADIANSLLYIKTYSYTKYKIKRDSLQSFLINCDIILKPHVIKYLGSEIDPSFLKLEVYRNIISYVIDSFPENDNSKKIKDYLKSWALVNKATNLNSKKEITVLLPEIEKISSQTYKDCLKNTFERLMKINNGDSAIDFVFSDNKGKRQNLKNYSGKVIYIDIWATWCGSCLKELPYLDSLRQKFKNNNDIEIVSLSIDDDLKKWKNYLIKNNILTSQWIIDRTILKDYNVITLPRTIIIDKDFNIALLNGGQPSSDRTFQFLNTLIQKNTQ